MNPGNDQRSKLLQGTQRLENASKRLDDAQRMALETESIGISTLGDLHRQRQQIERTRDGLSEADSWIAKSQGVLKNMQRKYFPIN
jgi:vesicle transport through interaction with t-SNAREs protein 1